MKNKLKKLIKMTLLITALCLAVALGLFVWIRTALPSFSMFTPRIQKALSRLEPEYRLEFGEIRASEAAAQLFPDVAVSELRVFSEQGELLAYCPKMIIRLRIGGLLLGKVQPVTAELSGLRLETGPWFSEKQADASTTEKAEASVPAILQKNTAFPQIRKLFGILNSLPSPPVSFRRLSIQDMEIAPPDYSPKTSLKMQKLTADLRTEQSAFLVSIEAACLFKGRSGRIQSEFRYFLNADEADLNFSFRDIALSPLGEIFPPLSFLKGADTAVSGKAEIRMGADGEMSADRIELSAEKGILRYPEIWKTDLQLNRLTITGAAADNLSRFRLDHFEADFGGPVFSGSGFITQNEPYPEIRMNVRARRLRLPEACRYWPYPVASDVRWWIEDHFESGRIESAELSLHLTPDDFRPGVPLSRKAVTAVVPFTDVTLNYYPPLEPVRNVSGKAGFSGHDIEIDAFGGEVYGSKVEKGRVFISWMERDDPFITIEADARGPADDLRAALDTLAGQESPTLKIGEGDAETHLSFDFPLTDFEPEDFHFSADSKIRKIRIPDYFTYAVDVKSLNAHFSDDQLIFDGKDCRVRHPKNLEEPLRASVIRGNGRILYDPPGLAMDSLTARIDEMTVNASGQVMKKTDAYPEIDMNLTLNRLDIQKVFSRWPKDAAPEAREWLKNGLKAGRIEGAALRINLEADDFTKQRLPGIAVEAEVPFSDVTLQYDPRLPPVKGAAGTATFTSRGTDITLTEGALKNSRIKNGKIRISGMDQNSPFLAVKTTAEGPLQDILDLLKDMGRAYDGPPVSPGAVARTELDLNFPITRLFTPNQLRYIAHTEISSLEIPDIRGIRLSDGNIRITAAPSNISAKALFHVNQQPLNLTMEAAVSEMGGKPESLTGIARITPELLKALHIPVTDTLRGSAPLEWAVFFQPSQTRIDFRADLTETAIDCRRWGWEKRKGERGSLTFSAVLKDDRLAGIENILAEGKNFHLSGNAEITAPPGKGWRLHLDSLKFGQNDLTLTLTDNGETCAFRFGGRQFDAGPLLQSLSAFETEGRKTEASVPVPSGSEKSKTYFNARIKGDIQNLMLRNGITIRNVFFTADKAAEGGVNRINLNGKISGTGDLRFTLSGEKGKKRMEIHTENAGDFLKGLGITEYLRGGVLDFQADAEGENFGKGRGEGRLTVENYTLIQTPILMQILSMASFVGIMEQLQTGGISFNGMELGFTYQNRTLSLEAGRMEGYSLGMTFDGEIHPERDELKISGVVVPFNLVNKVIDTIPVVGKLIVGKGIIATNYSLEGPLRTPRVSISPLSTLALGSLKDLFDNVRVQKKP